MLNRVSHVFFFFSLLTLLSACASGIHKASEYKIIPGVHTQKDVELLLGEPVEKSERTIYGKYSGDGSKQCYVDKKPVIEWFYNSYYGYCGPDEKGCDNVRDYRTSVLIVFDEHKKVCEVDSRECRSDDSCWDNPKNFTLRGYPKK